jgi:thiol-disulfide isomerase/thioredoxin
MIKFILGLIVSLSLSSIANATTEVYFFTASWCGPCQSAKKMYHEPDMVELIAQYDDNLLIDIDHHQNWKKYYKVTQIPTVIIAKVEVVNGKRQGTVLYRWVNGGKPSLKSALQKYLPQHEPVRNNDF